MLYSALQVNDLWGTLRSSERLSGDVCIFPVESASWTLSDESIPDADFQKKRGKFGRKYKKIFLFSLLYFIAIIIVVIERSKGIC